jgi:hypothetical protein
MNVFREWTFWFMKIKQIYIQVNAEKRFKNNSERRNDTRCQGLWEQKLKARGGRERKPLRR